MNRLDALYAAAAVAAAPVWMRKSRAGWRERFGTIEPLPPKSQRRRVMIHAVSVGEVNALRTLVPLLTPHVDVLVTAGTDTGLARATELFASTAQVRRYPLDFSSSVARFLDASSPDAVALVELEVWPNFLRACKERLIPTCVINGRLSDRSFKGYRRIRRWMAPSFQSLAFASVQNGIYRERFEYMGVASDRCFVSGSMKWDSARIQDSVPGADELRAAMRLDPALPLVVAGSTGPGEEELLHAAVGQRVQLLCAPRKPERFDEAARAMPGCVRRSNPASGDPSSRRFLLDTIGELGKAYSFADVVVVGRSFGDLFGSDPIEPAALGKPVVIGPSVADFQSIVESLESGGGLVRATRESLAADIHSLLSDPARRAAIADRARNRIRVLQGASERHALLLRAVADGRHFAEPFITDEAAS